MNKIFLRAIKIQREVSITNSPLSYLNPTKPYLKYFEFCINIVFDDVQI